MKNKDVYIRKYINKETPKKIIHHQRTYPSHKWRLNEKGEPDHWAWEYGYHNGYLCERCGYSFCKHCDPDGFDKEPCIVEYYTCPSCGKGIIRYKNIFYCSFCGQKIDNNNIEEDIKVYVR